MTIYYLYVKTHNKTGLKYLGKTKQLNPHTYRGSGSNWRTHILEHGYDVTTEILRECHSSAEVRSYGTYYSKLWSVAESIDWANKIPETGGGAGSIPGTKRSAITRENISKGHTGIKRSEETRQKIREVMTGSKRDKYKPRSAEHSANISAVHFGVKLSNEHRLAQSIGMKESWARRKAAKH